MVRRAGAGVAAAALLAAFLPPLLSASAAVDPNTGHDDTFDAYAPAASPSPVNIAGNTTLCGNPNEHQWKWVNGSAYPQTVEGQVTGSKLSPDDNPFNHHSRDRNFFIFPDPAYQNVLANPGNFSQGEDNEHGRIEVENEAAAMPAWVLPMQGDRVHVEGSFIWDCAHGKNGYRTEIHPPHLVMALRDAASQTWGPGRNGGTVPGPRPGWPSTMPGLGRTPIQTSRADIFASSDGGEATQVERQCDIDPCHPPVDWYVPLNAKDYDLHVPAPPKPDPNAQMVFTIEKKPLPNCASDDSSCGQMLDVTNDPNRVQVSPEVGGVRVHIDFTHGFTEPASYLYGVGMTVRVAWNRPATQPPRRVKVVVDGVHVANAMDGLVPCLTLLCSADGQFEIGASLGDTFRHMLLAGHGATYNDHQEVPYTEDVNEYDYGIRTDGNCALVSLGTTTPDPCSNTFSVSLLPGEPLRVYLRADEWDLSTNQDVGTVDHIFTGAQNYGIGATYLEWFQPKTSANDDAMESKCGNGDCVQVKYHIEDDPYPFAYTALASSSNPSVWGQPVTFTATVTHTPPSASTPTGTVTFREGNVVLGSPNVDGLGKATLTTSSLDVGPHTIIATYSGDGTYDPAASAPLPQTVDKADTVSLLSTPSGTSTFGQPVTFTDLVTAKPPGAGLPTGAVTFKEGANILATASLDGTGRAQLTTAALQPGSHTITADYPGDTHFNGSSYTVVQIVKCTTTIAGRVAGNFTVPAGVSTCFQAANVGGSVIVPPGTSVAFINSTIGGSINADGASAFSLCGSTVGSSVSVGNTTGFVLIGDPADDGCAGNQLRSSVGLSSNHGDVEVRANRISSALNVSGTTGTGPFAEDTGAEIEGNAIASSLSCAGNTPPPSNGGQPNTASGGRVGQCATAGF